MARRPPRRDRHPKQGEDLLEGLFRRLNLVGKWKEWRALSTWIEAAGPQVASRSRAERVRGSTLFVRVASSAWAQELGFLKADLVGKLNALPGGEGIDEIRFTVGPLKDAPDFAEDPTPRAAPPPAASRGHRIEDAPSLANAEIAAALDTVKDPEIRAQLVHMIARAGSPPRSSGK